MICDILNVRMRFVWLAFVAVMPAYAQFYPISSPNPQYLSTTTLIALPSASGLASVTGGGQTLSFSTNLDGVAVGSGWSVWGAPPDTETATPSVLATGEAQTSLTINLGSPAATFGLEIEPSNTGAIPTPVSYALTATFYNGTTVLGTVSRSVTYNGARLLAASSTTPITSVQISAPAAAGGFAMAQFRFGSGVIGAPSLAAIPALGFPELAALALLLAATGAILAHRQRASA